ncbi:PAS domain-containing methyl-accepting chemotaxis protein, partial [Pontibacterium sp.]|uniref:methyl-accepting chemotaxis protein n=1 Tax=Pontibacterium sp. TaxID=2036026 RepID=UPI0035689A10
ILYANDAFCSVSGFSLEQLQNKPHNIVRHADMPKEAFGNLWDSLKNDHAWRGIVKNRCANGDHYWVDAYVTPLYENGVKVGYQSVRTRPSDKQKRKAESIYALITQGKLNRLLSQSKVNTSALLASVGLVAVGSVASYLLQGPIASAVVTAITGISVASVWSWRTRKISALKSTAQNIASNSLIKLIYCDSSDELGDIQLAMTMQDARNRTVLGRLADINQTIRSAVGLTDNAIKNTDNGLSRQDNETDQVASAVGQMASATEEIALNTQQTSQVSQNACSVTEDGRTALQEVIKNTEALEKQVKLAAITSKELQSQADEIGNVLSVINDIADQTNLLALNAAIEAARAGEHGRGFAVVSDEVRTLAVRTQNSTQEIKAVVEHVQSAVNKNVQIMQESEKETANVLLATRKTDDAFVNVQSMMAEVSDRCTQIATASEEQTAVVSDVHQNISSIRDLSGENRKASRQTSEASLELHKLMGQLDSMVQAFEK